MEKFKFLSDQQVADREKSQQLNISGYDVVKNVWLKFNSYNFTHCAFTKEDMTSLLDLLNTLSVHTELVDKVDEIVYRIINNNCDLVLPKENLLGL